MRDREEQHQLEKEIQHTLRVGPSSCTSCGTDLDKHDYAFYRIGLLRAEIKVAIRLLGLPVTPGAIARELENVLLETRFDYRPKSREALK